MSRMWMMRSVEVGLAVVVVVMIVLATVSDGQTSGCGW